MAPDAPKPPPFTAGRERTEVRAPPHHVSEPRRVKGNSTEEHHVENRERDENQEVGHPGSWIEGQDVSIKLLDSANRFVIRRPRQTEGPAKLFDLIDAEILQEKMSTARLVVIQRRRRIAHLHPVYIVKNNTQPVTVEINPLDV